MSETKPNEVVVDPKDVVPEPNDAPVKTAAEIEAEAKVLEAELADLEKGDVKPADAEAKKLADQTQRKQIAQDKIDAIKNSNKDESDELSVADQVTMGVKGIKADSEKAKILTSYVKAGKCTNIEEALEHVGAKAEIEALTAIDDAKSIIDENDTTENQLKTKKEAVAAYKASGEFPEDQSMRDAITKSNLDEMDL